MERYLLIFTLVFIFGCHKESTPTVTAPTATAPTVAAPTVAAPTNTPAVQSTRLPEMDEFFVEWLKSHGHTDMVVDAGGVGVGDNPTRLQASLYGSNQNDNGKFVVEVEFTIRLPSGRSITDFIAGIGDSQEKAIKDALLNFTLTTFHVVYKGFINADDPHMSATMVTFDGVDRELIAGDIMLRGGALDENIDLNAIRAEIQGALKSESLGPGEHWIKVVYSQADNKPMTVAVTMDNADHPSLTTGVRKLNWPSLKGFYMAKQFLVIK